jgi:hypothetical protein
VGGLAVLVENVVGDIDDVVDRAKADGTETLLEPDGAWGDFNAGDDRRCVKRAILG